MNYASLLLFFVSALVLSCQLIPEPPPEDHYPITIELVEAQASLHRLANEVGDPFAAEVFILQTVCVLKITNNSPDELKVVSDYGTPYDDLRLRIRDSKGNRLVATSHTLMLDPTLESEWTVLEKGVTFVQLTASTPVGSVSPEDSFPFILSSELTETIQLEYFGGFPGSELSRAIQSNRISVRIEDRTTPIPRRPMQPVQPLPNRV